jgi:hypothetical protein
MKLPGASILSLDISFLQPSRSAGITHQSGVVLPQDFVDLDHYPLLEEIGTDGSGQSQQNPRVDAYGSGFGPAKPGRSGFWTVQKRNRINFAVPTQTSGGLPRPVVITNHGQLVRRLSFTRGKLSIPRSPPYLAFRTISKTWKILYDHSRIWEWDMRRCWLISTFDNEIVGRSSFCNIRNGRQGRQLLV